MHAGKRSVSSLFLLLSREISSRRNLDIDLEIDARENAIGVASMVLHRHTESSSRMGGGGQESRGRAISLKHAYLARFHAIGGFIGFRTIGDLLKNVKPILSIGASWLFCSSSSRMKVAFQQAVRSVRAFPLFSGASAI